MLKKWGPALLAAACVLLVLYGALIYYDNNFKYGRMRETPAVRPHEEPLLVMDSGVVSHSRPEATLRIAAPEQLKTPLNPRDPAVLSQGKSQYVNYCAPCHGPRYDGNGIVGQSFSPLPADLRSTAVQSKSDGALFQEISYGIPNGRQPPLATTITEIDRWRIVAYVKSLGTRN